MQEMQPEVFCPGYVLALAFKSLTAFAWAGQPFCAVAIVDSGECDANLRALLHSRCEHSSGRMLTAITLDDAASRFVHMLIWTIGGHSRRRAE